METSVLLHGFFSDHVIFIILKYQKMYFLKNQKIYSNYTFSSLFQYKIQETNTGLCTLIQDIGNMNII